MNAQKAKLIGIVFLLLFFGVVFPVCGQKLTRFVLAPNGLNLREASTPSSTRLATLPYGTRVTVLGAPSKAVIEVDNLQGGMTKVTANGMTGYVFDGYLCRFPAPKPQMSVEKYVESVREQGLEAHYESHHYDYDGYFRQENGVTLLKGTWREAFLVGKMLGEIPPKLNFPSARGEGDESYENPDKSDVAWSDQLDVARETNGEIRKISYYYRGEGSGSFVHISLPENFEGILIMVGGIAD